MELLYYCLRTAESTADVISDCAVDKESYKVFLIPPASP